MGARRLEKESVFRNPVPSADEGWNSVVGRKKGRTRDVESLSGWIEMDYDDVDSLWCLAGRMGGDPGIRPRRVLLLFLEIMMFQHPIRLAILRSLVVASTCWVVGIMALLPAFAQVSAQKTASGELRTPIRALIIDGQNNHNAWPKTTMMMKSYLESTGNFDVDVYRTRFTWNGKKWSKDFPLDDGKEYVDLASSKPDPEFRPKFSDYDVVISNFGHGAADWPESTRKNFVDFIQKGGGFVSIHAADNCFPNWKAYNEIIGLGGWGGRNEASGPFVYFDDKGKIVRDLSKGSGGGHGPQHEFSIVIRDSNHPITQGLPDSFLHARDELYERLRGPGVNMKILATSFASPQHRGSGRHEPMVMTIDYGKGRVFHTPLGHADYSCECVAFITLFQRGTEWAATGKVSIPVPDDFPNGAKSSSRKFETANQ